MSLREIPKQVFDRMTAERIVESYADLEEITRSQASQSSDLIYRELTAATCDMGQGIWLRLGGSLGRVSLEVIRSDEVPFDPANPAPAVFGSRVDLLARLSAGLLDRSEREGVFFSSSLGSVALRYPSEANLPNVTRVLHAAPIIGEIAQSTRELLSPPNT